MLCGPVCRHGRELYTCHESGGTLQDSGATRTSQSNISAALATAEARARAGLNMNPHFPGQDGIQSLTEVAQRDLDAALHLLADRAQYITGSSGAAIALRRSGRNDMQCRASVGRNTPELGALLSTEFGLSGESVRTRRPLRCDDAERDARVNREVCRQMGIASVMIMPVVHDNEVLGVFELFSSSVNAFGERDLSALERLSQMVETAVTLTQAIEGLPQRLQAEGHAPASTQEFSEAEEVVLEVEAAEPAQVPGPLESKPEVLAEVASGAIIEKSPTQVQVETDGDALLPTRAEEVITPRQVVESDAGATPSVSTPLATLQAPEAAPAPATGMASTKPLYWSTAAATDPGQPVEDQSHFPPVLRNLKKCEACGFPVSPTRVLCVDCEEKKWRGQLKTHPPSLRPTVAPPVPLQAPASEIAEKAAAGVSSSETPPEPALRAFAAAAQSSVVSSPLPAQLPSATRSASLAPAFVVSSLKENETPNPPGALKATTELTQPAPAASAEALSQPQVAATPDFILSAGLERRRSWFTANKYVLGVILAVMAAIGAFVLLR